ncbi:MAG: exodeoxyribonuclease VII large subunit, partial [Sneathiella sp.]|nr:exodeoxyribonuclease VII large subunit [Sneathiella sp.]
MSDPRAPAPSNIHEFTVSELSNALKRTVEDTYGRVRVRAEISGLKQAASGHVYLALKDDKSVLDGVMWRGSAQKLNFRPEDGLEVVCTGKLTTYPGRSKYQMVIDSMEPAGVGALMALLEERKRKLAAEGLFSPERKKQLPYLPQTIGVVTSPTGAVIRDILHRLRDRFPTHVLLWPVLVQGETAAEQVATAIHGFNNLTGEDKGLPRPDLIIVARGGGSLEDLWAFNEEVVVRAAAESRIPLISAVGHETDTTLIDYASDRRAPTPTAAAEMAVPVRSELLAYVEDMDRRIRRGLTRSISEKRDRLQGLSRGLRDPKSL